jgi:hypothetical protein
VHSRDVRSPHTEWTTPLNRFSDRRATDRRHAEKIGRTNAKRRRQLREVARLPGVNTRGRLISGLITTVMALAGFVTAGTLPAAATASPVQYVALGDSYAAGIGAPPYQPVPLGRKICIQSVDKSYPALLDDKGRIDLQANATCPGATTTDVGAMLDSPQNPLNPEIRLVTLTVGGADLNFSDVLTTCTLDATACTGAVNDALSLLPDLKSDLTNLYTEIAAAAPEARIVVTGYPLLFGRPPIDFNQDVINAVNNGGVALNKTIEDAVAEANENGNIDYVDVTEEFREHGVLLRVNNPDATDPDDTKAFIHSPFIICDPTIDPDCHDPGDPAAYHPTDEGYDAYADAIATKLPNGWLDKNKQLV